MTLSRRSTIKAIGVVGTGSTLTGTALAVSEHEDDERDPEEAPDDGEVGALRVGHFSPDAPNVDVYVDDQQILTDVAYDELSPYLEIAPGTYTLTITASGDEEPIYEETLPVDTDYYTAAAIGELEADDATDDGTGTDEETGEPETAAFIQQEEGNETDNATDGTGLGNGTDDTGLGNETDNGTDDTGLGNETDNATDGTGLGNGTDDTGLGNETDDTSPDDGALDDVEEDDPGTGTFEVLLLFDEGPDAIEQEGTSQLRLVHASPDMPAVDIAEGEMGRPIFENVAFGEPSGYVTVEPGTQTLEFFETGENDFGAGTGGETEEDDTDGEEPEEPETAAFIQENETVTENASDTDNETVTDNETATENGTVTDDEDGDDIGLGDDDGGENGDDLDGGGDDEVIEQADPVTSAEIDLEEDMSYTAFAIGYLESDGENATDDEADDEEGADDDRSFEVRVAVDGTEEGGDLDEEPDEAEADEEEIDNGEGDDLEDDSRDDEDEDGEHTADNDSDDDLEGDDHDDGYDGNHTEEPPAADD